MKTKTYGRNFTGMMYGKETFFADCGFLLAFLAWFDTEGGDWTKWKVEYD